MWNRLGWNIGTCRWWNWWREYFCQSWRVQAGEFPLGTMARTVGAERRVILGARVVRIVARLTRCVERRAMLCEPGRRAMRIGFVGADDRNDRRRSARRRDFGQGVADVALDANGLLVVLGKVFAVVAAETAGPILVPQVVRVGGPRQILGRKDQRLVHRFQKVNGRFDLGRVRLVIVGIVLGVESIESFD